MLHRSPVRAGRRTLTFRLPDDHGTVSVVGTFNDWTPGALVLAPAGDGWLCAEVEVPADEVVRFRYLGESQWWFDELDADEIDGEGSVVEPEPAAASEAPDATRHLLTDAARSDTEQVSEDGVSAGPAGEPTPAELAARKEEKLKRRRARLAKEAEKRQREIEKKRIAEEKKAARKAEEAEARARRIAREAEKAAARARAAAAKAAEKAREARLAHRLQAERRAKASAAAAEAAQQAAVAIAEADAVPPAPPAPPAAPGPPAAPAVH